MGNFFINNSSWIFTNNSIIVDCDQTELITNSKTFELAEKVCFS